MSRVLSLLLLVAATFSSFAQPVTLVTEINPRVAIVDPGASTTFQASVANPGDFRATDLRVRYELAGDAVIERIDSPNGWTCTVNEKSAECATPIVVIVARRFDVTVRAGSTNGGATTLTMTASSAEPVAGQQYISRATLQAYQTLAVETTADAGPGSLRAAIETANGLDHVAKIEFRMPAPVPAEGWFTIIPASPLPPITARRVYVDGKSQTRFTGDTNTRGPEIAIDGRLAHQGLEIHSPCLARVEGLTLGNFDANQGLWFTKSGECTDFSFESDVRLVADNYIGTDPTGTVAWPNRRGLRGDFGSGTIRNNVISGNTYSGIWIWVSSDRYSSYTIEGNKFGTAADGLAPLPNGAAGLLLGDRVSADVRRNVIANHPGMGVALVRGDTYVRIQENSMRDNGGIGIDWGIDGRSTDTLDDSQASDPNTPALLSARYDAGTNRTYFTMTASSQRIFGANPSFIVLDFYANRGPDGDGEEWIGQGAGQVRDDGAFDAWVPGDFRGKWINATLTRVPQFGLRTPRINSEFVTFGDDSTSEFSNAILVP